jgi:hypothetical protein
MKAVVFYAVYFFVWLIIAPFAGFVPGLQLMVEAFVVVYIVLMILGDLTSGTIFQYFFSTAKSLFVICYLLFSLQGGILTASYEGVSLLVDLRMFVVVALLLGLLGFAKSILQAINYMTQRAEPTML